MRLNLERVSEYGAFAIEPTDGREILDVFVDFETKLVIVQERGGVPGGQRPIYMTTIAPAAARVIPPGERKNRIDYSKRSETDERSGLLLVFWRELTTATGVETTEEELYEAEKRISSSRRVAFSRCAMPTLLDKHLLSPLEREELFWRTEYAAKSFYDRASYWSDQILRHVRWQSESGLDAYGGFTPAWYADAKRRDPDFDAVLAFVFERDENELRHQDCSPTEILRRIGNPNLFRRPE